MVLGFCIGGPFIWNLLRRAPNRIVAAVLAQPSGSRPEMRDLSFLRHQYEGLGSRADQAPARDHDGDSRHVSDIPKPKKRRGSRQQELVLDEGKGLSTKSQAYDLTSVINDVRNQVDTWRHLPASQRQVTPETSRLLQHWRHHEFGGVRPFFCQVEAVETAIWFTEVAPHLASGKRLIDNLKAVNAEANPNIERLALKLATGAGKTTVMAMLIAWQTLNAVRRPGSKHFTRGFLVVTPGLTIKDRLRVLQPNDPDNYYGTRELVPHDMLEDIKKARIVITNYHAFKRRDRLELSSGGRAAARRTHRSGAADGEPFRRATMNRRRSADRPSERPCLGDVSLTAGSPARRRAEGAEDPRLVPISTSSTARRTNAQSMTLRIESILPQSSARPLVIQAPAPRCRACLQSPRSVRALATRVALERRRDRSPAFPLPR